MENGAFDRKADYDAKNKQTEREPAGGNFFRRLQPHSPRQNGWRTRAQAGIGEFCRPGFPKLSDEDWRLTNVATMQN